MLFVGSRPARAGSWQFTCTGSGSATDTLAPWTHIPPYVANWIPPGPQTGSFQLLAGQGQFGGGAYYHVSYVAVIKVTVTATWIPASGQTATSDPAPPSVWLCESAQAEWTQGYSGSAADGLGETKSGSLGYPGSTGMASSSSAPPSTPPAHWKSYPVSGGKATLPTRTLRAEADATTLWQPDGDLCMAYIDSYSVTVHATPYNFRRTYFPDETPPTSVDKSYGSLVFHYSWSSTSGNLADLSGETIHENVAAPSSPSITVNGKLYFVPDYPPFNWEPAVLRDVSVDATLAQMQDTNTYGNSLNSTPASSFAKPYKADSFSLTQTFLFNDPATMAPGVEQSVPGDAGPITITDAVVVDASQPSGYSFVVTKYGIPSLPTPLP